MTTPSKDLYKKNGFLKSQPSVSEGIVLDVGGSNISTIINKLNDISGSLDSGLQVNGNTGAASSIPYATTVDVKTGSFSESLLTANLQSDTTRATVVFLNNTDVEISVILSSSAAPSYIVGASQTYEAIQTNAQLAHTFVYYDSQTPTKGKWFRTYTK